MSPNDTPVPLSDERLLAIFWTLRNGGRAAECVLWTHPYGFEVRCAVDGEVRQAAAQRRRDAAENLVLEWRQAFIAKGWIA